MELWEVPSAVAGSKEEPSTIDEQICNIDLKYQIRNKKNNKTKEREKSAYSLLFLCNPQQQTKTYCFFAEALS